MSSEILVIGRLRASSRTTRAVISFRQLGPAIAS